MSSRLGAIVRVHFVFISVLYLTFELTREDLTRGNSIWLAGYKAIFAVAAFKSTTAYLRLELNALIERTRQLQCLALSSTSGGEVFALYREERLSNPDGAEASCGERAFAHCERIPPEPYGDPARVFWCTLTAFLVLYNTAHLVLTPSSHVSPLFFGTPAYVLYWGAVRTTRTLLT